MFKRLLINKTLSFFFFYHVNVVQMYLKITSCSLLLWLVLVDKDLNYVEVTVN